MLLVVKAGCFYYSKTMDTSIENILTKFHDTCIQLFNIVGHDDAEAEANYTQLMATSTQLAISQLITTLPKDQQDTLLAQLQSSKTVEEAFPLVTDHFTPQQFSDALTTSFTQIMQLYFSQISDSLTPEQHKEISTLLVASITE